MGDLQKELAGLCRIARPVEFDSGGTLVRGRHPAITDAILEGQHPIRAWEYSQALRALERWWPALATIQIADVGGAGSNFYKTLTTQGPESYPRTVHVIDPSLATPDGQRGIVHGLLPGATAVKYELAEWAGYAANLWAYDAVFCLSVIEHVPLDHVTRFLENLCSLVRPGGLLVLTCDLVPQLPDTRHFHWMRAGWAPTPLTLAQWSYLAFPAFKFDLLDTLYDEWRGPTVFDYTVASLAFVRQP